MSWRTGHTNPHGSSATTFAGASLAGAGGGAAAAGVSGAVPAGIVLEFGAIVVIFDGTGPDAGP